MMMTSTLIQRRHRNLARVPDGLAALAGLLVAAGTVATGYWSTGYGVCTNGICRMVMHPVPLWGYPLLAFGGLVAGGLLFYYRWRALLLGFGIAVPLFIVASFGIGWEFFPAGLVSLVAGLRPHGGRPAR